MQHPSLQPLTPTLCRHMIAYFTKQNNEFERAYWVRELDKADKKLFTITPIK